MPDVNNGRPQETDQQKRAWSEWFQRYQADYLWCLNQRDLRERYAGQVVILHNRVVLGSGYSGAEARADARQRLEARGESMPAENALLIMIVPAQLWVDDPIPYAGDDSSSPASARADSEGAS
jgi:hypothetical protein